MPAPVRSAVRHLPSPKLALFCFFAVLLWLAGGATRADVVGQAIIRTAAWGCVILLVLFDEGRIAWRGRGVLILLALCALVAALQLVPLPPSWWASLPGRAPFAAANAIAGGPAPWRPLAIVPGAALNALGSLIVPFATFCFVACGRPLHDRTVLIVLLSLVIAHLFLALLQFAGVALYVPLINGGEEVSGGFANRNHFAVLMACGLLIAPVWAFFDGRSPGWRGPATLALLPLVALAILASGSRAGSACALLALLIGGLIVRRFLQRTLRRFPRWVPTAAMGAVVGALGLLVTFSVMADRAKSVRRVLELDPSQDMRRAGLPTVMNMTREYWPVGEGLGGFDPIFRMHEPFALLHTNYFNRAHNDLLEIVLDAGLPGLLLLVGGLIWVTRNAIRACRPDPTPEAMLPRLGGGLLLILVLASAADYPLRSPIMMAVAVVAATWLTGAGPRPGSSALPKSSDLL